jgi:hyaluronoglucosaminidase
VTEIDDVHLEPSSDPAPAMTELGIIEGFYGKPWTWAERAETVGFLAAHEYRFYLYAPKADQYLRRKWTLPHPNLMADELHGLARICRDYGVRFGIGLSPYELHERFTDDARAALSEKLRSLDDFAIDDLGILFDDMRGDTPDLADRQVEIVDWIAARTSASRVIVCPSYYSDDPVLDRAFGKRPDNYLETLGQRLDPAIDLFWTGEEVCSREISPAHVDRVAEVIRRKPFLWDNYPVNDGQRMSQFLHVRAFTGRPANLASHIAAHGINPALQPTLSRVPALSLVESYRLGDRYAYGDAFRRAADLVLGPDLGPMLWEDLLVLQDVGLDRLGKKEDLLRSRWTDVDHAAAREIIAWLNGAYRITDEIVQTQ